VRCVSCATGEGLLCDGCKVSLDRIRPPLCARCGAPTAWPVARCQECAGRRVAFRSARAAVHYDEVVRRLVAGWKERGLRRLDEIVADVVVAVVARPDAHVITFIPADRDRSLWRGTNTAEALAQALGVRWDLQVVPLLRRTRRIGRQRGRSRPERRANVREAFRVDELVRQRVVLVDDVFTTGSTVGAAATELRRAGAPAVDVVTFARAVRR
jgi:ComF family protein